MSKLKTLLVSLVLRSLTPLRPKIANVTRWSSTFDMLERYFELEPFFEDLLEDEPDMVEYMLTPQQKQSVGNDSCLFI